MIADHSRIQQINEGLLGIMITDHSQIKQFNEEGF